MIKEFTGNDAKNFADAIKAKLQEIGDEYGVSIDTGQIRLENLKMMNFMVTAAVENIPLEETPSGQEFIWAAPRYGFNKEDLGKTFRFKGDIWTITGWHDRSRKYKVFCEKLRDGTVSRFVPSHVKSLLA